MHDLKFEKNKINKGFKFIGGIDEVGRGPMAGPVISACVVIDENFQVNDVLKEVKDSKKLTEKKREKLFLEISKEVKSIGIGICDNETIDRVNILQATFLSMKIAISNCKTKADFIFVDGNQEIPVLVTPQKTIPKGDNLVFTIAAASIIAKVTRDRLMKGYAMKYPEYGFEKHKGYGTKAHMEAIKSSGPCPIHRLSFGMLQKYK